MKLTDPSRFNAPRFFNAFGASVTAALEKFAAEMTEAARKLPDREYWRGYEDGMTDAQDVLAARAIGGEEQHPAPVSSPMTHKPNEQEQSNG